MDKKHQTPLPKAQWIETLDKRISSAAVILELPDERAIVVKAWYKKYWSLPGGVVDQGESPQTAAVREVAEEIGLTLDPAALEFCWVLYRKSPTLESYQFTFRMQITEQQLEQVFLQEEEIDTYELVTKQQVLESNDDTYGSIVQAWARGDRGYIEREFPANE